MGKYTIAHNYSARTDGRQFGPWLAGDEVEIDDADAEWVRNDSPGVLGDDATTTAGAAEKKPRRRAKADEAEPVEVAVVPPGGDGTPMTGDGPQA